MRPYRMNLNQQCKNASEIISDAHANESLTDNNCNNNRIQVEIFVAQHCFMCQYAYEIVELIERDFSQVKLQVIDIADPDASIPEVVFATPTYLLNGRVWSLGNPSPAQVTEQLTELLSAEESVDATGKDKLQNTSGKR